MAHRGLPHDVDAVDVDGADLVALVPLQEVHDAARVARVHHAAPQGVLRGTRNEENEPIGQQSAQHAWGQLVGGGRAAAAGLTYLADAEALDVVGQAHGGELAVGAVPAEAEDGRHHELVEVRARRRPQLLPRRQPLPRDPRLRACIIRIWLGQKPRSKSI